MAVHLVVAVVGCYQNVVPAHLLICKILHSGDEEWPPNSDHVNGPAWSRCCWWTTMLQHNSLVLWWFHRDQDWYPPLV